MAALHVESALALRAGLAFLDGFDLTGSHSLRSLLDGFALTGSNSLCSVLDGFALTGSHSLRSFLDGFALKGSHSLRSCAAVHCFLIAIGSGAAMVKLARTIFLKFPFCGGS